MKASEIQTFYLLHLPPPLPHFLIAYFRLVLHSAVPDCVSVFQNIYNSEEDRKEKKTDQGRTHLQKWRQTSKDIYQYWTWEGISRKRGLLMNTPSL